MTRASSADPLPSVGAPLDGARSAGAGRRPATPLQNRRPFSLWLAVFLGFACLAVAYFFAFRAAHAAQIKDVPLATKGGRP